MRRQMLISLATLLLLPGVVNAGGLTFTENLVANFEFSLLGGTVINPGPTTPFIPFEAIGSLTFTLDSSINDPSQPTTVPFTNVTGMLAGVSPPRFPSLHDQPRPALTFLGGGTNEYRVRQPWQCHRRRCVGSVDEVGYGRYSGQPDTVHERRLAFRRHYQFDSVFVWHGTGRAADFNVYLDDGGSDPLVVIGRNWTLTVVPEPSSFILLAAGVMGLGGVTLRKSAGLSLRGCGRSEVWRHWL